VRAEDIVREEQERFDGWLVALQAVPTIRHLRARAESIREAELQRALSRTRLSDGDRERVEAMTRSIVNKILHAPIARLRDETDREEGLAMLEAARSLFGLDRATPREPASRGSAFHGSAGGEIDSDDEPER
jgi:glutamyl-tRNA reductase